MTESQALEQYAASRDAEAFAFLVQSYQRLVYAAARRRLARVADIEDAVQLTFLKLANAAGSIRHNLSLWLYTTAINSANDLIRKDATRRRHEMAWNDKEASHTSIANHRTPADDAMETEEWHRLTTLIDEAIEELPAEQQLLLIEHFFRNRSQRELAAELQVTQPTIQRRLGSAVDALRQRLAQHGYQGATGMIATALPQLGSAEVPATLSSELVKVGLAGKAGSGAAAPVAPWVGLSASMGGKIAIGVGISAACVLAAVLAAPLFTTPPAPLPAAAPPAASPVLAAVKEPEDLLIDSYRLAEGQNVRRIDPPHVPEREAYLDQEMPRIAGSAVHDRQWAQRTRNILLRWKDNHLEYECIGYLSSFDSMANWMSEDWWFQLDHLDRLAWDPGISDWVVRDSLPLPDFLAAMAPMISADLGTTVEFQKQIVRRPCIVLSGELREAPRDSGNFQMVAVTLEPLPDEEFQRWLASPGNPTRNTFTAFTFRQAGRHLDTPVFTTLWPKGSMKLIFSPEVKLRHTDADYRATLGKVVDRIQSQIGGTWAIEDRDIETWEPVIK